MVQDKSKEMLKTIIESLNDKKAENIRIIDISEISVIADYFVIANGTNVNQVQALADNVEENMYKCGYDDPRVEGYRDASWILLDYTDVIVHVFDKENRNFYDLERVWRDGKEIDPDNI